MTRCGIEVNQMAAGSKPEAEEDASAKSHKAKP
jgi:hypothetical protein